MTISKDGNKYLARLVDGLVHDILDLTDDELAAEIRDRGDDPLTVAARARNTFEKAILDLGKRRRAAAREAVDADALVPRKIIKLDPVSARARLDKLLRQFPDTAKKLTLAARKGEGLSYADVLGLLSNLEELGLLDEDDP